ncbi:hypothetical protein GCM10027418_15300 [Mariniluteicoccus endophyticus]
MSDERPDFTWQEFERRAGSQPAPSDDERFTGCYRHPDRTTGIRCQRCDKPICGECMHPASVGFQCPGCVGASVPPRASAGRRRPSGGALAGRFGASGPVSTTVAIMVISAAVAMMDLVTRGMASSFLAFSAPAVSAGQVWRLVTGVFVSGGLLNLALNLLFLWLVGTQVEREIGRWRLLGILVVSTLGASAALMLAGVGGMGLLFAAILGLLSALAAVKYAHGEDIRGDLILFALLLGMNLLFGPAGFLAQLGALVAGGAAGLVLAKAPWQGRDRFQALGMTGIGVACLVLSAVGALV